MTDPTTTGAAASPAPTRFGLTLRFATLNLWGENGPHERRLALAAEALAAVDADVIALQEVREIPGRLPNQAETLGRWLGREVAFTPSTEWGGGMEGLAVLSRFAIANRTAQELPHSKKDEGRIVLSCALATPAGPLWVHTTHLSYRQTEGKLREDQVMAVDACVAEQAAPALGAAEPPQVIAGDFNTEPDADEIRWLKGLTTLDGRRVFYQDAWAIARPREPGITWATENSWRAGMNWLKTDRRLDYIFVTEMRRNGRGRICGAQLICNRADADGIFPSDHYGVVADIQIAADQSSARPTP